MIFTPVTDGRMAVGRRIVFLAEDENRRYIGPPFFKACRNRDALNIGCDNGQGRNAQWPNRPAKDQTNAGNGDKQMSEFRAVRVE